MTEEKDIIKEMSILEAIQAHPEIMDVLTKHGFHCIGCHAAQFENIEQGAVVHGIDIEELKKDIEKAIEEAKQKKETKSESEETENKTEETENKSEEKTEGEKDE